MDRDSDDEPLIDLQSMGINEALTPVPRASGPQDRMRIVCTLARYIKTLPSSEHMHIYPLLRLCTMLAVALQGRLCIVSVSLKRRPCSGLPQVPGSFCVWMVAQLMDDVRGKREGRLLPVRRSVDVAGFCEVIFGRTAVPFQAALPVLETLTRQPPAKKNNGDGVPSVTPLCLNTLLFLTQGWPGGGKRSTVVEVAFSDQEERATLVFTTYAGRSGSRLIVFDPRTGLLAGYAAERHRELPLVSLERLCLRYTCPGAGFVCQRTLASMRDGTDRLPCPGQRLSQERVRTECACRVNPEACTTAGFLGLPWTDADGVSGTLIVHMRPLLR